MICPSCQHENDDGNETCFGCGRRLAPTITVTRGTVIAGRYEILSQLGRGGMGVVYRAHDRVLEEPVAIKILRPDVAQAPDLARRFRSEIKLARRVTHKNVCRIHEYDQDAGLSYISMELIEGQDLRKLIRARPLPSREAFNLAIQIAAGLDAIHDAGIIHRDLKTPNIMLDPRGVVKLMDFGIAKSATAETTIGATGTGQIIGTPEYMSPEQAQGIAVDVRSDVYALGIVLFEIFTGKVPFRGETPLKTILQHIHTPAPLAGPEAERLPSTLIPVLRKALSKGAAARYANAGEMLSALKTAQMAFTRGVSLTADTERAGPAVESIATVRLEQQVAATDAPVMRRPALADADGPAIRRRVLAARRRLPVWLWLMPIVIGCCAGVVFVGLHAWVPRGGPETLPQESAIETPPSEAVSTSSLVAAVPEPEELEPTETPSATPTAAPTVPPARRVRVAPVTKSPPPDARDRRAAPADRSKPREVPVAVASTPVAPPAAAPADRSKPRDVPVAVASTPVAPPAAAPAQEGGFLQVMVVPGAELVLDGNSLGSVTSRKINLPAGAHVVRLLHPEYRPLQRKVRILPGETVRVIVDLAEEAIRKQD